ncbi:hypothetical protein L6V77_05825 [Myxococcota bacterium]|nr:hypothetical protein [Myxococcota bacterium]
MTRRRPPDCPPISVGAALALLLTVGCGGPPGRPPGDGTVDGARWRLDRDASVATRAWWDWLDGRGDALARTFLSPVPKVIASEPPSPPAGTPSPDAASSPAPAPAPVASELAALRLLMAQLADERLDPSTRLRAATLAYVVLPPGSPGAHLAWRWAEDAAREVPEGVARRRALLGVGVSVPETTSDVRHTVRISFLPWLDARRLIQHPPSLAPDGTLSALGKSWALTESKPRIDPDSLAASVHPLPAGEAHLVVQNGGRLLAFRDGRLVLASPEDRPPPGRVRFSAPGTGPLVLVYSSASVPTVERWPAAFVPTRPPARSPTDALLAALLALADDDREGVEAWLAGAPDTPVVRGLRAEAAATDPSVPAGQSRDARHAAWEALLPAAPMRARFELARLARQGGDLDAAHRHLEHLAAHPGAAVPRLHFQVHFGLGWYDEAAVDLERAERAIADLCDLLDDRLALQGARGNTTGRFALVEPLARCGRVREAADLLVDLDRPTLALARLDALTGPAAAEPKVDATRRRALVALGRLDEARALALKSAAQAPATEARPDPEAALAAVDLGDSEPAALGRALDALVRAHPTAREAREWMLVHPQTSPFGEVMLDTEAVLAAYGVDAAADPERYAGPAVRVLDHDVTIYFADGRRLRWVHEILAIRTREAAENFGEVHLPEGASAVAVFNRKADGRRLHAEDMPEKESLSVPDLAIGDAIVALYLEPGDNGYLYDTGFLTPRFTLGSHELPAYLQRHDVFGPDGTTPEAHLTAGAPAPTPITLGALARGGLRLEARAVPILPPEDDAVPTGLYLPGARIGRSVTLAADLEYTRDRVLSRRTRNAEFEAWARETAGEGKPMERIARLARAVRARVDGRTGLIADDATRMWASGHGHRALVLSAALEAVGVPHRLLLARPKVHVPAGPFEQVADFPYALLAVGDAFETVIDPGPDRAPVGFVPFGFLGGDALTVWPPDAPDAGLRARPLPSTRSVEDRRAVHMRLRWREDGALSGSVEDALHGQESIVVGDYLARLDAAVRPKVAERLLVPVLGAGMVSGFVDPVASAETAPEGPLVLRYDFTARGGDSLALGLFPVSPGRAWAARAERRTPMAIELPTRQHVVVDVEGPPDLRCSAPASVTLGHGSVRFRRTVTTLGPGRFRLESHLELDGGVISPADYAAFADAARAIDPAETVLFERAVGDPGRK